MATETSVPTANGANQYATLTVNGAATHYECVDDPVASPDDATTYLQLPSAGAAASDETYTFTAFAITSSAIASVIVTGRAKETGGNRAYRPVIVVNGTIYRGASQALTTSYADYPSPEWTTNPDTGLAWVEADVEGTGSNPLQEFGFLTDSPFAGRTTEITQVYISVNYTPSGGGVSIPVILHSFDGGFNPIKKNGGFING